MKSFLFLIVYFVREMLTKLFYVYKISKLKVNWKKKFFNNYTYPVNIFPINLIEIGNYTYGPIEAYSYNASNEGLVIGNYCSIAKNVKFILGGNHRTDCLFTYPIITEFSSERSTEAISKGPIIIEDDVWLGFGATILSGVRIGQGSVIGANTVVTKTVPPYSIVVGNPAVVLKCRFDSDLISIIERNSDKIYTLNECFIAKNIELFKKSVEISVLEELLNKISNR